MLRIALLLATVGCVLGATIPDGLLPHSNGRIVGGGEATISAFPWQVSLQRSGSHGCGATIYSSEITITAAHCISGVSAKQLRIRAGSSNWSSGGVVVAVVAFLKHENFVAPTSENDIAVMRLESSLAFSSTIRPIALASVEPPSGAAAAVTGWGVTKYNAYDIPEVLRYANVKMISSGECASEAYDYGSEIKSIMICAAAAGKDACQDDSGGPLVSGGVLVGVVSWGEGCALPNYPGVYVNVALLKPWIEKAASVV